MKYMRVDHRRFDIAMPQQLLNGSNVRAGFKQVRGKGMAERMARGSFRKPGLRLMHGEEAHLLLALDDDERASLLAFAKAVSAAWNPER